jgi:ABC-type glutathione transport system ATPase component
LRRPFRHLHYPGPPNLGSRKARIPGLNRQVLNLLADIRDQTAVSYLVFSHDLAVVRQLAEETIVLQRGRIVERGRTADVLDRPKDDYTKRLRASVPRPGWNPVRRRVTTPCSEVDRS